MKHSGTPSLSIPLVVSLLGTPADTSTAAVASLFVGGAQSLLKGLGVMAWEAEQSAAEARLPLLLVTLEEPALVAAAIAAKKAAAAGNHRLEIAVLRVDDSKAPPPEGVDRLWRFPGAARKENQAFDRLAAGSWLTLRSQVRLFIGTQEFAAEPPLRPATLNALGATDANTFWMATARAGRVYTEELALAPFYDKGHRPFQPPVRRMDEADRGLVALITSDAPVLLSQIDVEDSHWSAREWVANHIAPIARWNALPVDLSGRPVEEQRAWMNLWTADGAEPAPVAPPRQSLLELADVYTRVQIARKPLERKSAVAVRAMLGFDPFPEECRPLLRSLGLLVGSIASLSFVACITFACYAKLYPLSSVDPHYVGRLGWAIGFTLLALAAVTVVRKKGITEAIHFEEDLRALREALRVQLFFWMAGNPEFAADQFPRRHRGRLGAVRMAVANLALTSLRNEDWQDDQPLTHAEADRVRRLWVEQQFRRYRGGAPSPSTPLRKQDKVGQLETLESTVHGLAGGLTAWAISGAFFHGILLLGSHPWYPMPFGGTGLLLGLGCLIALIMPLFWSRIHHWLTHHGGMHSVPMLVGFLGGGALVFLWMGIGLLGYPWLESVVRVGKKSLPYWWVSGCVLVGLLAGILHTRYHVMNLRANFVNARASAILHGRVNMAMSQILSHPVGTGAPLDPATEQEFREYVRELGRAGLAENSRWLLEQRERPLSLPHLT